MRQGDGADLLGPNDPRSASIGVIYVAPSDDRQTVLTAILTQDKLGRKQVVVVLPEQNRAFQRPIDFDGLKNMRRGLKAQIAFVAPGGPGPAEFARQRRFPVYSSQESFAESLKAESPVNVTTNGSAKRGFFGFGRKIKPVSADTMASASSNRILEEPISPLPTNESWAVPQEASAPPKPVPGEDPDIADERNGSTGQNAAAIGMAGPAAGAGFAGDYNAGSTLENSDMDWPAQSRADTGSPVNEDTSSSSTPVQPDEYATPAGSNSMQNKTDRGPAIISFSAAAPRPKTTRKLPVPPVEDAAVPIIASSATQQDGPGATSPTRRGNTGKTAAVVAGAGVGAAMAGRAAGGGGGLPPSGNTPGGPGGGGGGVGGSRKRTRLLLAILLGVLTLLLIGGITVAAIPGGLGSLAKFVPGVATTATVTITPASKDLVNSYVITAVTGTPDPAKRQVAARILTATSSTQSKTANSTGSIPGVQATGQLTFLNTSTSAKTFSSVVLTGADGVQVSFNGPITVPALPPSSRTVTGFAVNVGTAGNIRAFDINGSCCAAGITVKNGAFSGGQDPQSNSVVQQSDINGAANALAAALTPGTQSALQKQMRPNEQLVANTLKCNKSTFTADHKAGDLARTVTVTVAITCKEEVYDQQGALTMAANLLKMAAGKDPGPAFALTGNVVTRVTTAMLADTKGTVSLDVSAEGVWVYQFSDAVKQGFANHIANMSKQDAIKYFLGQGGQPGQPGVSDVQIVISSGNALPDASHITIEIKLIPGATGTPTPGTPTVAPTGTVTPTATSPTTPTPTPGLGGS
jgi:hypothetical protein